MSRKINGTNLEGFWLNEFPLIEKWLELKLTSPSRDHWYPEFPLSPKLPAATSASDKPIELQISELRKAVRDGRYTIGIDWGREEQEKNRFDL